MPTINTSYSPTAGTSDKAKNFLAISGQASSPMHASSTLSESPVKHLMLKKPSSIAFFINLLSPLSPLPSKLTIPGDSADISTAFTPRLQGPSSPKKAPSPTRQFQKIERQRSNRWQEKLEKATRIKAQLDLAKVKRLAARSETVRLRVLILRSRERLNSMRMNAKQEYKMSLTTLNRHQLIRRNQQKWGRMVEKAQTVALLQKMKKVLELRKTVSDGFLNLLNDHPGRRLSLLDGLRVEDISDFDVELTAIAEDPTRLASSVHSESTAYALSPEETFSSPTKRHEYLFAEKDFSSEPILLSIRRSQSVPFEILESFADDPFYQLQELLPPINRTALRELELDEILTNSQLRHDLCFDPNLKFKPSADEASITLSETYWAEVKSEADSGALYRIPLLLAEIRQILIELLPNGDEQKADIFSNIDPKLVAQQIQHGIMNPTALVNYLSKLIKTNCAPIRDDLVDEMVLICGKGDISNTLKIAFELMEWMKLDYANHQISRLLPYITSHAQDFEWRMFKLDSKIVKTKAWLKDSYEKFQDTDLVPNGILSLIGNASTFPETLPETLSLDKSRLVSYYNDWQDITILACILVIFKGCAGPKCTPMNLIEIKDNIWVLLNDNETTMDHITLQLQHEAGKVRGADLSATERKSLSNLVDTSLAPDSPLYKLIQSRVRIHLLTVASGNVPSGLEKHGLGHVEEKIQLLGGHVKHVLEMNLQIYARLYAVILEDLKSQLNGGIGASDLDIINTAEAK